MFARMYLLLVPAKHMLLKRPFKQSEDSELGVVCVVMRRGLHIRVLSNSVSGHTCFVLVPGRPKTFGPWKPNVLGFDSPLFSSIVIFKKPAVFPGFSEAFWKEGMSGNNGKEWEIMEIIRGLVRERRIPGKNGNGRYP